MKDIILLAVLAVIIIFAAAYVLRARKKGCIGCPCSCTNAKTELKTDNNAPERRKYPCGGSCAGCAGCGAKMTNNK